MKGLEKIPSTGDLSEAYDGLLSDAVSIEKLALWIQWCRFDPRLAEILVKFLAYHWETLPLMALRTALLAHPWPQAFGVLAENVLASDFLTPEQRRVFRKWSATVLSGVRPAHYELFFIGLRKIAGKEMMRDVDESSQTYLRWGYFGRDLLVNKAKASEARTLIPLMNRRRMLQDLMKEKTRITVNDYQAALEYRISRRQAELDLSREKRLTPFGKTRGRFYRVK